VKSKQQVRVDFDFNSFSIGHSLVKFYQVIECIQNGLIRQDMRSFEYKLSRDSRVDDNFHQVSLIGGKSWTWSNHISSFLFPTSPSLNNPSRLSHKQYKMSKPYKKRVIQADSDESQDDEPLVSSLSPKYT